MRTVKDDQVTLYADFDNRERVQSIGKKRQPGKTIPVIDFSAYTNDGSREERKRVARALHDTCIDTGFFYLAQHGISEAEIALAHDWGRLFFELPREVKVACNHTPVGGKNPSANPDKETDQKETYSLPRPLLPGETEDHPGRTVGRGLWVDPALMPGFREFLEAHFVKRIRVAQRLCRALALSLDLPEDYLDAAHRFPSGSLTYNYYPPVNPATAGRTQWGISPHTDYGSFSLLSQDELGGLEVRDSSGAWIDLPPIPGTFIVISPISSRAGPTAITYRACIARQISTPARAHGFRCRCSLIRTRQQSSNACRPARGRAIPRNTSRSRPGLMCRP